MKYEDFEKIGCPYQRICGIAVENPFYNPQNLIQSGNSMNDEVLPYSDMQLFNLTNQINISEGTHNDQLSILSDDALNEYWEKYNQFIRFPRIIEYREHEIATSTITLRGRNPIFEEIPDYKIGIVNL